MADPETLPGWRWPEQATMQDKHFRLRYGPLALHAVSDAFSSIGEVIAQFAEAERQIEAMLLGPFGRSAPLARKLLTRWRDYPEAMKLVGEGWADEGREDAARSLSAALPLVRVAWRVRDALAHGTWAQSDAQPEAAIWFRTTVMSEQHAAMIASWPEWQAPEPFPGEGDNVPRVWRADDFRRASALAVGVNATLSALSVCAARSPEEVAPLHTALRRPGLLASFPT
jgi:hypothetical protein